MPDGTDLSSANYTKAGPSFLAQQPIAPPRLDDKSDAWWNIAYPKLESRLSMLRAWRWSWWWAWADLAAYNRPDRYIPWVAANLMQKGRPLNDQIIDSTGLLAVNICAAGMWNGLIDPARQWMKLTYEPAWGRPDQEALEWLQHATEILYTMFQRSNFYTVMAQAFQDVVVFGTSPVIVYEDEQDGARCYNPRAGEYFLGSGARLSNDTLYREFLYTTAQVIGFFGWKNCPYQIQALWRQGGGAMDQEHVIVHSIEPNTPIARPGESASPLYIVPRYFAWREVYWLKGQRNRFPLTRRGFNEQPFFVIRWRVSSNDPYGRSPAMDCLGDNKQIQQMTLRQNEFGEKMVRPPMVAPPEMKNEPASIMPGMITYSNALNGKPLFTPAFQLDGQGMQWIIGAIDKISQRIKEAMFVPTFMAITQMAGVQPRNELELTKRDLERLQALGPFIELFTNEAANPAVMRYLAIGERRGLIRPRPASLRRQPIKVAFESIISIAQKATKTVALKDVATSMGVATAAAKTAGAPAPARKINWDRWAERLTEASNLDPDIVYTDEVVAQHDAIRHQEEKAAQQRQMAPALAKNAIDAAKVLTQAPPSTSPALDALIGATGATGQ